MPNFGINIVFFGTEMFSLTALQALVEDDYSIAAVVTKPDSASGRGMQLREPAIKAYALEHGIRVLQPERLGDIEADIEAIPNRIGVLSSYGKIIPQSTLDLFERGIVNIHPSLLPKYRGPSPIETALMNGDPQTGVSIMRLTAAMDAGPVYAQETLELAEDANAKDLYTLCAQTGSHLLIRELPRIINHELAPNDQDDALATYTRLLNKKDSIVDPSVQTADEIERHVRAFLEYPRTRTTLDGHDIIITNAHVANNGGSGLIIDCAYNTRLIIDELITPNGKHASGADFQHGYLK